MNSKDSEITLRSFGDSVEHLGTLYDATKVNFLRNRCIFGANIKGKLADLERKDFKLFLEDSTSNKLENLGVEAELRVSVLSGLATFGGRGCYKSSENSRKKTIKFILTCEVTTQQEDLDYSSEKYQLIPGTLQSSDRDEPIPATHFVSRIIWGGRAFISFEETVSDKNEITDLKGSLEAEIKLAVAKISGKAQVDLKKEQEDRLRRLNITMQTDFDDETIPIDLDSVLNVLPKISRLIKKQNEGKGIPLQYTLSPLYWIANRIKGALRCAKLVYSLQSTMLDQIEKIFNRIEKLNRELTKSIELAEKVEKVMKVEDMNKLKLWKKEVGEKEVDFKSKSCQILPQIRNGTRQPDDYQELCGENNIYDNLFEAVESGLREYKDKNHKFLKWIKKFQKAGASFISQRLSVRDYVSTKDTVWVLHVTEPLPYDISLVTEFYDKLEKRQKQDEQTKYCIYRDTKETCIERWEKGRLKFLQTKDFASDALQLVDGIYFGHKKEGRPHGIGRKIWNDGSSYDGEWKESSPHGKGEMVWADGRSYNGEWKDSFCHGKGKMIWANGTVSDGEWLDGLVYPGKIKICWMRSRNPKPQDFEASLCLSVLQLKNIIKERLNNPIDIILEYQSLQLEDYIKLKDIPNFSDKTPFNIIDKVTLGC